MLGVATGILVSVGPTVHPQSTFTAESIFPSSVVRAVKVMQFVMVRLMRRRYMDTVYPLRVEHSIEHFRFVLNICIRLNLNSELGKLIIQRDLF